MGFPGGSLVKKKKFTCQHRSCRRCRFNPWVWKTPWKRKGQPTQYFCWDNPMDRGVRRATVRGVTESGTTKHKHTTHIYNIQP